MTTEQLAALKEVASKAAEHIPHVHGCQCMKVFERTFRPTRCLELLEEVERLTALIDKSQTCVVCEATLCEPETPPHCEDCILTEEHYEK
jgi:hypothetical protein